jgi:hypothetical protein
LRADVIQRVLNSGASLALETEQVKVPMFEGAASTDDDDDVFGLNLIAITFNFTVEFVDISLAR